MFVGTDVSISPGYTPGGRTAGSRDDSVFDLWRSCQTFSQSGCTIFPSRA